MTFLKMTFSFNLCVHLRSCHRVHSSLRDSLLTNPIFHLNVALPYLVITCHSFMTQHTYRHTRLICLVLTLRV